MAREALIIADAGPIIALAAIGRLELLRDVAGEVRVPRAVYDEVVAGAPRPGATEITAASWVRVVDADRGLAEAFQLVVDRGEAEALALAKVTDGALLVVDDQRARRVAAQLHLRITGTLGILDLAKRAQLIPAVAPELAKLIAVGFRLDEVIRQAFLRRISE